MADENQNNQGPNLRFTVMPDLEGIGKSGPPPAPPKAPPKNMAQKADFSPPERPNPTPPQLKPTPPKPKIASEPPTPKPQPPMTKMPKPTVESVQAMPKTKPDIPDSPKEALTKNINLEDPEVYPKSSPPPPPRLTEALRERRTGQQGQIVGTRNTKKIIIVAVAGVLVAGAAAAGFGFWNNKRSESVAEAPPVNNNNVTSVPITEPEPTDSDNDGLVDSEEQELGTDQNDADTDGDGLADGDEVNVFKTSPFTPHTDADGFTDSKEVRDGYSPLQGGSTRLSDAEVAVILTALNNNKLHQTTVATLLAGEFWKSKMSASSTGASANTSASFTYQDPVYGYQLVLPGKWKKSQASPTNLTFTEEGSSVARYVQVQAFVGVNEQGQVSTEGLLESEIVRLAAIASGDVHYRKATVGGIAGSRLSLESKRSSANPDSLGLTSATIEYIVPTSTAAFIVTVSCTTDGVNSCMTQAEAAAGSIERDMRF